MRTCACPARRWRRRHALTLTLTLTLTLSLTLTLTRTRTLTLTLTLTRPPLVLRNHTQHTIFLGHASASALGETPPFPAPSHEVLKLGPGRTGRFFMEGVG